MSLYMRVILRQQPEQHLNVVTKQNANLFTFSIQLFENGYNQNAGLARKKTYLPCIVLVAIWINRCVGGVYGEIIVAMNIFYEAN